LNLREEFKGIRIIFEYTKIFSSITTPTLISSYFLGKKIAKYSIIKLTKLVNKLYKKLYKK